MDSLCLKTGIHGIASSISVSGAIEVRSNPSQLSAVGRSSTVDKPPQNTVSPFSRFSYKHPLKSLWFGGGGNNRYKGMALDDAVLVDNKDEAKVIGGEEGVSGPMGLEEKNENWVLKILHVRSLWREEQGKDGGVEETAEEGNIAVNERMTKCHDEEDDEEKDGGDDEGCDACRIVGGEDENEVQFDKDSFSRLLRRVSLAEARMYAQMSYLGSLAYCIPKIKPGNLLRYYGLRYITSSLEKTEMAARTDKSQVLSESNEPETKIKDPMEGKEQKNIGHRISASVAYDIVASAASYLHSQTRSIIPFNGSKVNKAGEDSCEASHDINSEMASLMATTDSVTAVVAAKEELKQAVADNLNSTGSSPCEWYICDDDQSGTRFFVIQGSETLASWQANLLFEPIQFEGLDVLVHRGIYEAAKGIYEQMLPEVLLHLDSHGDRATFRFTGHSLGGSLALLVNLMLLIRREVPVSSLLPVIAFGAPSIMCGGDLLLRRLGLPRNHVQSVTMHRDIVPRAFSCKYPRHVAELLKAVNGSFRTHPCLNNQKLLYTPMGEFLILQPDDKFSPNHHLLPSGSGLYLLDCPLSDANDEKQLRAAQMVFLNSPHPLEILSDRSAYGSEGTIQRDHDMSSYLKSVRGVIRQELNQIRKAKREHRRKVWWPLVASHGINSGIIIGRPVGSPNLGQEQFNFSRMLQTGRESLKRFSRLVASQHMHLFVVLLLPARLLLLEAYSMVSFN